MHSSQASRDFQLDEKEPAARGSGRLKIEGWGLLERSAPRKTEAEFSRSKQAADASGGWGPVLDRTGHEKGFPNRFCDVTEVVAQNSGDEKF